MNAAILNRDFTHPQDGWYQIEPKGNHLNKASGVMQVVDDQAIESMVNRFAQDAKAPNFAGMLIDHEHFKHDTEKETIAYGWLTEMQGRTDGLYGKIRWTNTGRQAVDGGDYRFFSTEYKASEAMILNREPVRMRPLRLDGLTLTNDPNNRGGKPITNREEEFRRGLAAAAGSDINITKNKKMKSVATKLGLSADASEESILAAVTEIQNRLSAAEPKIVLLTNRGNELEAAIKGLAGEQVVILLESHGVKEEAIINRLTPVLLGLKNREERVSFLNDVIGAPKTETPKASNGGKILNRADAKQPGTSGTGNTQSDEAKKADVIRNRANELRGASPHRNWDDCWNQAVTENSK